MAVGIALALARFVAPPIGHPTSRVIADCVSGRKGLAWVRAVRANQWVITGRRLSSRELDRAAVAVLRHQARCLFDLYHTRRNPEAMKALSPYSDEVGALIERSRSRRGGAMVVFPHLSSYDIAFIANAYRGLEVQILTLPQPSSGYRAQNRIRCVEGFDVTPVCEASNRKAIERMKDGGLVITGIDRPVEGKSRSLNFFGHASCLPVGHIRMAMMANVPVIPAAVTMRSDGKYHLTVSEPIPMCPDPDPIVAVRRNAEAVLQIIAGFIRQAPEQWLMYYPVWPQVAAEMPC